MKLRSSALQAHFQALFHFRPFAVEDAEVDSVSKATRGGDYVLTECAFFFCANAENSATRRFVQRVGLQFYPDTVPDFERLSQHQVFRFGVAGSALPRRRDPCGANLDSTIGPVDVHEACAANDFSGRALDCGEDDGLSRSLLGEHLLDECVEVLAGLHRVRKPAKNIGEIVVCEFPESGFVLAAEWFEANYGSFQGD